MVQDDGAKFACEAFHKALDHRMRNEVTLSVLRYVSGTRIVGLLNREIGEYMKRITFRQSVRSIYTETTSLSSYGVTGRAQNNVWTVPPRIFDPPGPPRIEGYEEGNIVKAGEALTLLCISEGGNPPPELIWYRSNVQIDATYYQIVGDTATANNLTFIVSAADNTGSYHCKTSNAATKEPLIASIKLSVYCKLKLSFIFSFYLM
ncbi:synaptogenesis protein syg-2 [Trichonephila inaurata madagascariensis]|uniref:Synaptogenesis protein syg-2 n=1 Tax=Trichonephila inaurata madagascariensis TaxID=2747483 RepID=A0A8X7BXF3_9ARAC|nr:synaptogenesis protein syg-2 [Trichonephila inaurata madagascariensis]